MTIYDTTDFRCNAPIAVTIGNFDGLHIGHRRLIKKTVEIARHNSWQAGVLSFSPHPRELLTGEIMPVILTQNEKSMLLSDMGIDAFFSYPFTLEFMDMPPASFLEEIIFGQLNAKAVIVGEGYRFGKNRSGDFSLLEHLAHNHNAKAIAVPHIHAGNSKISSSTLRECVLARRFDIIRELTAHPYFVFGHAKKRGDTYIINTPSNKLLPPDGEYKTQLVINTQPRPAITTISARTLEISVDTIDLNNQPVLVTF